MKDPLVDISFFLHFHMIKMRKDPAAVSPSVPHQIQVQAKCFQVSPSLWIRDGLELVKTAMPLKNENIM